VLESAWYGLLAVASAVLAATALYIYSNPVGSQIANGVQGRYFLPLAGVFAILLEARLPILPRALRTSWLVATLMLIEAILTGLVVNAAYSVI